MKKVVIVQRRLTHYRVPMFEALRESLASENIELDLLVGKGTPKEAERRDAGQLDWAKQIPTYYLPGGRLCWQSFSPNLRGADLVIVTQENALLANHLLLARRRPYKLAFWGHGANLQSGSPRGVKERFKRWTTTRADWWFAYTEMSAKLVVNAGFPAEKVTVLNNAVDTTRMISDRDSVLPEDIEALRKELGIRDNPVGIFLGSLDLPKRLDFLFAAAEQIRAHIPDFRLLIIGDGPQRASVQSWCDAHPWADWVGSKHDQEKAVYLALGDVLLNPGMVGLGILDSFVFGLPLITTDCGMHSPEISYMVSDYNGIITENDVDIYSNRCISALIRNDYISHLKMGCISSSNNITLGAMVGNFHIGISKSIE